MDSRVAAAAFFALAISQVTVPYSHAESPRLQIRGQVVLPDGSPASHGRIALYEQMQEPAAVECDAEGRFLIDGKFLLNATLTAQSAERTWQRRHHIPSSHARTISQSPLRIELQPARRVDVVVTHQGQAAAGTRLSIQYDPLNHAVADVQGRAVLWVADSPWDILLSAMHTEFGVAVARLSPAQAESPMETIELTLQAIQPASVRVVDESGIGVAGVKLVANLSLNGKGFVLGPGFDELMPVTDADGVARLQAPVERYFLDAELLTEGWLPETIDQPDELHKVPTVHVRSKRVITGRLTVPAECDPEGLLISGRSFGPGDRSDLAGTRVAADGTFALAIAAEHCYALAVYDRDWSAEPFTGVFRRTASPDLTSPLELTAYRATPVQIRATIGSEFAPLKHHFVDLSRVVKVWWTDANGENHSGETRIGDWLVTDDQGFIRTGTGRGTWRVRTSHGEWNKTLELKVDSDNPQSIDLHKPYGAARELRGRLVSKDSGGADFSNVRLIAAQYADERNGTPSATVAEISVQKDGSFTTSTTFPNVFFLALDGDHGMSGTAAVTETTSDFTIPLLAAATHEGKLVDAQRAPMTGAKLTLSLRDIKDVPFSHATTDADGRFRFEGVPVEVPLRLEMEWNSERDHVAQLGFEPGEHRTAVQQASSVSIQPASTAPPLQSLGERLKIMARDAHLASMHVLVVLRGDGEQTATFASQSVLDADTDQAAIYDYLPLVIDATGLPADVGFVKEAGWPVPEPNELALVALDGQGKTLATQRIAVEAADAIQQAASFLKAHRPPALDASQLFQSALKEAEQSGRRVLVQFGGPRCGPCFSLSRWMDDQKSLLAKEFVVLKLHSGQQAGASELLERYCRKPGGIPWMAILDAQGELLATGDGPLGNIGRPSSFEGRRHFRRMLESSAQRLSAQEIEALIATLEQ